jgi:hypothetical protein
VGNRFGTSSELSTRNECGRRSVDFPRVVTLAVPLSHALNRYDDFELEHQGQGPSLRADPSTSLRYFFCYEGLLFCNEGHFLCYGGPVSWQWDRPSESAEAARHWFGTHAEPIFTLSPPILLRLMFATPGLLPLQVDIADNRLCGFGNLDPFDPNDLRTAIAKAAHRLRLGGKRVQ